MTATTKTRIEIGGTYILNRPNRLADGGFAPVVVLAHPGDWIVTVRDGCSGEEYPADPVHLRTAKQAAASVLPKVSGKVNTFRAHGLHYTVKKHRTEFSLFAEGTGSRSRWGTRDEMTADIAHVMQYGVLPPASGSPGI